MSRRHRQHRGSSPATVGKDNDELLRGLSSEVEGDHRLQVLSPLTPDRVGMKRREFLLLTAAAGASTAAGSFWGYLTSDGGSPPGVMPDLESFVMTTCLMCPGGCGIKVRRLDGYPTSIAGNPNHPV